MLGGHCEMRFTDVFVADEDVLGGVDEGFGYAQVRLGPARMTHVMRWLGAAPVPTRSRCGTPPSGRLSARGSRTSG